MDIPSLRQEQRKLLNKKFTNLADACHVACLKIRQEMAPATMSPATDARVSVDEALQQQLSCRVIDTQEEGPCCHRHYL